MEKKEILQQLIDYYANGNKSEFGRMLGLTPQAITAWKRRNTFDLKLIATKCTNINPHWLMTGEGDMFTENEDQEPIPTFKTKPQSSDLEKILLSMQQEVAENNKFMREQMQMMQTMLSETMQLMKKSQEYYERALELHEKSNEDQILTRRHVTTYLAERDHK